MVVIGDLYGVRSVMKVVLDVEIQGIKRWDPNQRLGASRYFWAFSSYLNSPLHLCVPRCRENRITPSGPPVLFKG